MEENQIETKVIDITQPVQQQSSQPVEKPPEETQKEIDWKRFKEARRVERQQKEEAERKATEKAAEAEALKAALAAVVNKQPIQDTSQVDESDEERLNKRINAAIEEREKVREQKRAEEERQKLPTMLNQSFNDFDKICTDENLDYLKFHHPEVASAFKYAPDNFETWSNIYKAIKRYVPNPTSDKDSKKADKNSSKPQSMSVAGVTQTGDQAPMQLDDKRKADNWARMQKRMKGIA